MEPTKKPNPQLVFLSMLIQIAVGLYIGQMIYNQLDDKFIAHIVIALAVLQNIYSGIKDRNRPTELNSPKKPEILPKKLTVSHIVALILVAVYILNMRYQYVPPDLFAQLLLTFISAGLATSFIPYILKQINK
jgi:hypothetical protein